MPTEGLFAFRKCLQAPGTKVRDGSGVAKWRQWGGWCEPSERKRISPLAPPVLEGDKATPFHSQGKNKRFCSQCLSIPCWKSPSSSSGDSERDPRAGLSQLRHPRTPCRCTGLALATRWHKMPEIRVSNTHESHPGRARGAGAVRAAALSPSLWRSPGIAVQSLCGCERSLGVVGCGVHRTKGWLRGRG